MADKRLASTHALQIRLGRRPQRLQALSWIDERAALLSCWL
jgi:hypothetical protein